MKKVVFLIYSMENAGGSERVTANISNQLSLDENFEIYVVTLFGSKSFFSLNKRINLICLNDSKKKNIISLGKLFINQIRLLRPDTIVGVSISKLNIFLSVCTFFFKYRINLVASEHIAYGSVGKFQNLIKRILYRQFDTIGVLTKHDSTLMKSEGFKNVVLLRNASSFYPDIDDLKPILKREKTILAIGRLEKQKGFERLIEAWSKVYLVHNEWKLIIVGEGSLNFSLKSQINRSFPDQLVCQILPFTDMPRDLYSNSQIYALSSYFEGLPMVMIEAMCFGLPCVSFDCETGPKDIIENMVNGLLVKNGDIVDFSKNLSELISNDGLRMKFSSKCLEYRSEYKIELIIEQWKKILV